MEAAAIITLREGINTGSSITKVIEVKAYWGPDNADPYSVLFELEDGSRGRIPVRNIAGIYPKKTETQNTSK
jgi:hypothetical protein